MQFPAAAAELAKGGARLWLNPSGVSWGIFQKVVEAQPAEGGRGMRRKTESNGSAVNGAAAGAAQPNVLETDSPVQWFKAIKVRAIQILSSPGPIFSLKVQNWLLRRFVMVNVKNRNAGAGLLWNKEHTALCQCLPLPAAVCTGALPTFTHARMHVYECVYVCMQNEVEKEGMREAHLRDAVALCDHFSWFEERMEAGEQLTEVRLLLPSLLQTSRPFRFRESGESSKLASCCALVLGATRDVLELGAGA